MELRLQRDTYKVLQYVDSHAALLFQIYDGFTLYRGAVEKCTCNTFYCWLSYSTHNGGAELTFVLVHIVIDTFKDSVCTGVAGSHSDAVSGVPSAPCYHEEGSHKNQQHNSDKIFVPYEVCRAVVDFICQPWPLE